MSLAQIDFGLPPLAAESLPDFTDENSARAWLAGLPLTNVTMAHTQLMRQLNLKISIDREQKCLKSGRLWVS